MKAKATIELTKIEADQLLVLLDALTRGAGMDHASNCVYFSQKIKEAFKVPGDKSNGVARKVKVKP